VGRKTAGSGRGAGDFQEGSFKRRKGKRRVAVGAGRSTRRDGKQCTFRVRQGGRRCAFALAALEIHVEAWALGGAGYGRQFGGLLCRGAQSARGPANLWPGLTSEAQIRRSCRS